MPNPQLSDDTSEDDQYLTLDLSDEEIEEIADLLFSDSQDEDTGEIELSPEGADDEDENQDDDN